MSRAARYYLPFAAAFVRGKLTQGYPLQLSRRLVETALDELTLQEHEQIFEAGHSAGLKMHKFKRLTGLPRVKRVIGALHAVFPSGILDIGSGRGAFLWALLETFPHLAVAAIDDNARRAEDLQAVSLGGIDRLSARRGTVVNLPYKDNSYDVVLMLEVLEHIPEPQQALAEIVRVAQRFVVVSVPSKRDDNPEHIQLFSESRLRCMFTAIQATRLSFDYVPGHIVVVVNVGGATQ